MVFFIVTGGRVPSYLGCSGSFVSIILTISSYTSTSNSEMNTNTATVQGAILVLSLTYAAVAASVMMFGYTWLEFFMPPSKQVLVYVFAHHLMLTWRCSCYRIDHHKHRATSFIPVV